MTEWDPLHSVVFFTMGPVRFLFKDLSLLYNGATELFFPRFVLFLFPCNSGISRFLIQYGCRKSY